MKPLPIFDKESYDLIWLKKDKTFGLITLYVGPDLIHHTKEKKSCKKKILDLGHLPKFLWNYEGHSSKSTWNQAFQSQNRWLRCCWGVYARSKNLRTSIITSRGKTIIFVIVSIVQNDLSTTFKYFSIIFDSLPLFIKNATTPSLEEILFKLTIIKLPWGTWVNCPSKIKPIQMLSQPLLNLGLTKWKAKTQSPPQRKESYATTVIRSEILQVLPC